MDARAVYFGDSPLHVVPIHNQASKSNSARLEKLKMQATPPTTPRPYAAASIPSQLTRWRRESLASMPCPVAMLGRISLVARAPTRGRVCLRGSRREGACRQICLSISALRVIKAAKPPSRSRPLDGQQGGEAPDMATTNQSGAAGLLGT